MSQTHWLADERDAHVVMFAFKKFIGVVIAPSAIVLLLALAAGIARWRNRPRLAMWLLVSSVALTYVCSISVVSDALLRPLEREYSRLDESHAPANVNHVVVLGSSYWPRKSRPITGALDSEGVVRAVEGVRLFRTFALPHLVLSGGMATSPAPSAQGYAVLARSLGVDDATITVLDKSNDTADEAVSIRKLLGDAPFILVTSAYHMPRAMRLMQRAGTHPIPAPTAQRASDADSISITSFVPTATSLGRTEMALHEYLGLLALYAGLK